MRAWVAAASLVAALAARPGLAQPDPQDLFPTRGGADSGEARDPGGGEVADQSHGACGDEGALAPIHVGLRDTGLDMGREACTESAVRGALRGAALVDNGDFYGTLVGSLFVEARFDHVAGVEVAVGARVVDWRFAQTAVFPGRELAIGPLYVSGHRAVHARWMGRDVTLGHSLRLEVPGTDTGTDPLIVAAAPAVHAAMALSERTRLHGRITALLWSALADSGVDTRAALLTGVDGAAGLGRYVALIAGPEIQGGWYGAGLDHLLVRVGVRVAVGRSRAAVGLAVPLFGAERSDASVIVSFSQRR